MREKAMAITSSIHWWPLSTCVQASVIEPVCRAARATGVMVVMISAPSSRRSVRSPAAR